MPGFLWYSGAQALLFGTIMKITTILLLAVATIFAETVQFPITCLDVQGVGSSIKISDMNKPVITLEVETGKFTANYDISLFANTSFVMASKSVSSVYEFTMQTYDANVAPRNVFNAVAMCPSVTKDQAFALMKAQNVPYIIYRDIDSGDEAWAHISVKDSAKIARTGGHLRPGIYVVKDPISVIHVATYGYTCGDGTFDWMTAYHEVEDHLRTYQEDTGWTSTEQTIDIRINIAAMSIPSLPSCVSVKRIPTYINDAKRLLDSYPCKIKDGGSVITLKRCGI